MREIKTHRADDSPAIVVQASDWLSPGGAPVHYKVQCIHTDGALNIIFQNGAIDVAGYNGITMESLLAVCIDRLECFQSGPFPCEDNEAALMHLNMAMEFLHSRTRRINKNKRGA